jgi:2-amino-4-hydroxy-6-hydroxymethyldihydropteridine diphosphokinase
MVDAADNHLRAPGVAQGGVYIALGSNVGDREGHIRGALQELDAIPEIAVVRSSSLYENAAVGGPPGQPDYINAVAELDTTLSPRALLECLLRVETRHGRTRDVPGGPRTLDLDLLLYRDRRIEEPGLSVPHRRMWERDFVLRPLAEICPAPRLAAFRALQQSGTAP